MSENPSPSRRQFLKDTTRLAAATAIQAGTDGKYPVPQPGVVTNREF
jgi:hypothetical protein